MRPSAGEIIQKRRQARGLSLAALAAEVGVTKSYISRLESGARRASESQLRRVASCLGLPPDLILLAAGVLPPDVAAQVKANTNEVAASIRQTLEQPATSFPTRLSPSMAESLDGKLRSASEPTRGKAFEGDVRVGKNSTAYRAHSYHTKVPPEAIAKLVNHYTRLGDLVLDPFCGSGMTGVAALGTGRVALLSDLSPAAVHIARNYTTPCSPSALRKALERITASCQPTMAWLYGTTTGQVEYTVWSDVFGCPECGAEMVYWEVARDLSGGIRDDIHCEKCGGAFQKRDLSWTGERPVETNASGLPSARGRSVHPPTREELDLISQSSSMPIPYWLPQVPFKQDREMWRAAHSAAGIDSVQGFYTQRNLHALGALRHAILEEQDPRVRDALLFAFTAMVNRASKRYQWNAKRPTNVMTGTLYVSSLRYEWNVWSLFQRKARDVLRYFEFLGTPSTRCETVLTSATTLGHIPDGVVDFVFMDPPFGSNIFYADSSLLWDAWLGSLTDPVQEIVVNRHRNPGAGGKTLTDYQRLMAGAFSEVGRVLRPGAFATLAFNNTDDAVWVAIQDAIAAAGFEVASAVELDKVHPSIKGVKGRQAKEDVASLDSLISLRRARRNGNPTPPAHPEHIRRIARAYLQEIAPNTATTDALFSRVIRSLLSSNGSLAGVTMNAVREACAGLSNDQGAWALPTESRHHPLIADVGSPFGCVVRDYLVSPGDTLTAADIARKPKRVLPLLSPMVSGSRNTDLYNAHSYHTKVPPEAIEPFIEHFTRPGDVVLDPFAGSGMTGVAAAMAGRRAILSDLAVASAHLSFNHTQPCDPHALLHHFQLLNDRVSAEFGRIYETVGPDGSAGYIHYTLWSRDAICPRCTRAFSLWDVIDRQTGRMGSRITCPGCGADLAKHSLRYTGNRQVLISLSTADGHRLERPPLPSDIAHAESFRREDIPHWFPAVPVDSTREMYLRSALHLQGISCLADFYTPRNLRALSLLWHEIQTISNTRVRHALQFAFTNTAWHGTRMRRFNARGGQRPLTGTLYVPQISSEANVLEVMRNKVKQLVKFYRTYRPLEGPLPALSICDAGFLVGLPDKSVDYVFTDPPFGSNIFYADCNLIWESWLGGLTNVAAEAVVNRSLVPERGGKTVGDYERLMTSALAEVYRVLKADAWATLVFHNTDPEVWRALQSASDAAGFSIERAAGLGRQQQSHKGYKGRDGAEAVAHFDVILSLKKRKLGRRKVRAGLRSDSVAAIIREVLEDLPEDMRTAQHVHSAVLRRVAEMGADLGAVTFGAVRDACSERLRQATTRNGA